MPAQVRPAPPLAVFYGAVLLGGMLGGVTRYLVSLAVPAQPGHIPWGILAVNLSGAFTLSLLLSGWVRRGHVSHPWRPFLATGILGSFTTWSTFMADTYALYREASALLATGYLVTTTALGAVFAALGWWTAQRFVPHVDEQVAA
jgi:CrcB protein